MAFIPSLFDSRSIFDPFYSSDVWAPIGSKEVSSFALAKVDWKETEKAHVFLVDLPGMKKEEVKVEVEDDQALKISGERFVGKEEKNEKWHRVERVNGKFTRRFRLPQNVRLDQVKASMENGVLTVTVPKVMERRPETKCIDISG